MKIMDFCIILTCASVLLTSQAYSFSFLYKEIIIQEYKITFSWIKAVDCEDTTLYSLVRRLGDNISATEIGNKTSFTIKRNETTVGNNIYKIHVEARSNFMICGLSEVSLQFLPDVNTKKLIVLPQEDTCIRPSSTHFNVIWPKSDNETEGSCICGLWTHISQCTCLEEGNHFGVYNIAKDEQIHICWSNITNNTVIQVVFDSFNENIGISIPSVNQELYESHQIVIAEHPAPPEIEYNVSGLTEKRVTLCLISVYDGNAPIQNYSISVTDITGYRVSYVQNKISSRSCGNIPDLFSSCGPFNITVKSQNAVGFSKPNEMIVSDNEFRNVCKCISDNVNLTVSYLNFSDPQVAVLKISCETLYVGDDTFHVNVELKDEYNNQIINYTAVNCSTTFSYQSLQYSTTYSLHFKWTLPDGMNCSLINTANVFTTGSSPPLSDAVVAGIIIGIVSVPVVFIILMFTIIFCCLCPCSCCEQSTTYSASNYDKRKS